MTSETTTENPRRRPKGDKRARTRAKLLEAARELIREKGYEHTTLQDVAQRAGMTSGAIYGNFKNRDELFIALAEVHWAPIKPEFRPGSSFAEKMRALAEATIAAIPERRLAAGGRLDRHGLRPHPRGDTRPGARDHGPRLRCGRRVAARRR